MATTNKFGLTKDFINIKILYMRTAKDKYSSLVDKIVDYIKNSDKKDDKGWVPASVKDYFNLGLNSVAMGPLVQSLVMSHPNIIANFAYTPRKVWYYKWVEPEEKQALGFKAVIFRNVSDEVLEKLSKHMPNVDANNVYDIVGVYDYLLGLGSKKWVLCDLSYMVTHKYMSAQNLITALDLLYDSKLLTYFTRKKSSVKNAIDWFILHLTDDSNFDELDKQAKNNPDDIVYEKPTRFFTKKRTKKSNNTKPAPKKKVVETPELDETVEKAPALSEEKKETGTRFSTASAQAIVIPMPEPKKSIEEKPVILEPIIKQDMTHKQEESATSLEQGTALMKKQFADYINLYKKQTQTIIETQHNNMNKSYGVLDKMQKQVTELQNQITDLKAELDEQKKMATLYKDYETKFLMNMNEVLDNMLGQMMTAIESFASLPTYKRNDVNMTNKFKANVFKIAGDATESIVQFEPDKTPDEIK